MNKAMIFNFDVDKENRKIKVERSFDDLSQLEAMIAMGFKEGFTMGLGNLDELLAKLQKKTA